MKQNRIGQKIQAVSVMKQLGMSESDITIFNFEEKFKFFDNTNSLSAELMEILREKAKQLESELDILIFAATFEITNIGEMVSFLFVSSYEEDWKYQFRQRQSNGLFSDFFVSAYVVNLDYPENSEMGTVAIRNYYGKLVRIG